MPQQDIDTSYMTDLVHNQGLGNNYIPHGNYEENFDKLSIVDKEKFYELFDTYKEQNKIKPDQLHTHLWDYLLGNHPVKPKDERIDYYTELSKHEQIGGYEKKTMDSFHSGLINPIVGYLTKRSCQVIFQHLIQFSSGIDFQHLPKGFYLAKHPEQDHSFVLEYNPEFKNVQPPSKNDVLAITIPSVETLESNKYYENPFNGDQALWYEQLLVYRRDHPTCSYSELRGAFLRFSEIVNEMNLTFTKPKFDYYGPCNPVALIGRWVTVLSNPALKKEDRQRQFELLPELFLHNSYEAIRAITDYAHTSRPCGFLHPAMFLTSYGFTYYNRKDRAGFRFDDTHDENDLRKKSILWRTVAYSHQRNSLEFYEKAFSINLDERLTRIIWTSTTDTNHYATTREDEEKEYAILQKIETTVENLPIRWSYRIPYGNKEMFIFAVHQLRGISIDFTLEYIKHLHSITMLETYGENPPYLILKSKLVLMANALESNLYRGGKFFLKNETWSADLSFVKFIELMYCFYCRSGGKLQPTVLDIFSAEDYIPTSEGLPSFTLLAPHLSTFNITHEYQIKLVIDSWNQHVTKDTQDRLIFCFNLFHDASSNKGLSHDHILKLIEFISSNKQKLGDWRIIIIRQMMTQFTLNFPTSYFDELLESIEDEENNGILSTFQLEVRMSFDSPLIADNIISFAKEMVKNLTCDKRKTLTSMLKLVTQLKYELRENDFLKIMNSFITFKSSFLEHPEDFILLLQSIRDTKQVFGFELISTRASFEKIHMNLASKCNCFINYLFSIQNNIGDISFLDMELMASFTLKSNITSNSQTSIISNDFKNILSDIKIAINHQKKSEEYIYELFHAITIDHDNDFIQQLKSFSSHVRLIATLLENTHSDVFYSLLSLHRQNPQQLNTIFENMLHFEDSKKIQIATYISKIPLSEFSLETITDILYCIREDESWGIFHRSTERPPYLSPPQIQAHLKNPSAFKDSYQEFSKKPYGERQLKNAFDISAYKAQRNHFVGCNDIFTDEIGNKISDLLIKLRERTMNDLIDFIQKIKIKTTFSPDDKLNLMCYCVEVLARTAYQTDPNGTKSSQELNTTQIMSVYMQLIDPKHRTMSQIDTGEGKSRIMMLLAACQAAQGKTVDFLTNDSSLAERDYLSYTTFFDALSIKTGLITLKSTPSDYKKGGINFTDTNQLLLLRNKSDIECSPYDFMDENSSNRCLLIDEADVFIHDKNIESHNYASRAIDLSRFVWVYNYLILFLHRLNVKDKAEFTPTEKMSEEFIAYLGTLVVSTDKMRMTQSLFEKNPDQILTWLRSAHTALRMTVNVDYLVTGSNQDELYLVRTAEGRSCYSRKILVRPRNESSTFANGVHQCLCAIENIKNSADEFVIFPENRSQRSSYPTTFMNSYNEGSVHAVSGTSRSQLVEAYPELNIDELSYYIVPREKKLIRDDKPVWLAKDEVQHLDFIRSTIDEHMQGRSVLIICRNDEHALKLKAALENCYTGIIHVHGHTKHADELKAIAQAGTIGNITISTSLLMGRGVDISANNMLVISTFVPTQEDERQIQGRTGRFGRPGMYRLIANIADPDNLISNPSFNHSKDVIRAQHRMMINAKNEEEICRMYAVFQEEITQRFLSQYKTSKDQALLQAWEQYLKSMLDKWNRVKSKILHHVNNQALEQAKELFSQFTEMQIASLPVANKVAFSSTQCDKIASTLPIYQQYRHSRVAPIPLQEKYHRSDDGQARIYSSLFAQSRASINGDRPWFANYKAYSEGRGVLFADFRALLSGERPLFANLGPSSARYWLDLAIRRSPVKLCNVAASGGCAVGANPPVRWILSHCEPILTIIIAAYSSDKRA